MPGSKTLDIRRLIILFAVVLVSLIFCYASSAATKIPADPWAPDMFLFQCPGVSCPSLVAQAITGPVSGSNGRISFTMNAAVFSDPVNVYCAGCLDFVYQVTNSASSQNSIDRVTAGDYTGWKIDVGFVLPGSDLGPSFADGIVWPRLADPRPGVPAGVAGFTYDLPAKLPPKPIPPGSTSVPMIVETNATAFAGGVVSVIDTDGSTTVSGFQPAADPPHIAADAADAAVPEPTSFVGVAVALLAFVRMRRRRPDGRGEPPHV